MSRYIFYPRKTKPHVPVMEAWPDMMTYLDRIQRQRPSYGSWRAKQ